MAGGAGLAIAGSPALAQAGGQVDTNEPVQCTPGVDADCAQVTDETTQAAGIVVTGSRIVRRDYESNSPLVTVDESLLQSSTTSAIEQNLNKLPQFVPSKTPVGANAGDIQPTATNTPGSANISLRGLGANRNLVLIDGRRATPGNATGVVDINTIPSAAVERVEIITGGASATYGADAIGGVANFILKKNFQGLELDGTAGLSEHGGGFEYQVSGIMGADFDDGRGNVSFAMSTNKREAIYQRDLPWFVDRWADPNVGGTGFFLPRAGVSSNGVNPDQMISYFPGANLNGSTLVLKPGADPTLSSSYSCTYPNNPNPIDSGLCVPANFGFGYFNLFQNTGAFTLYANPDGSVFTGSGFAQRGGASQAQGVDGYTLKQTAIGTVAANDTYLYEQLPLTRYNFLARGNYEINDWIGVFGQAMYTHVHTHTVQEPGPVVGGWSASIPYGYDAYTGDSARGIPSSLNADGSTNAAYLPGGQYGLTACPTTGGCPKYVVFPLPADLQALMLGRGTGTNFLGNLLANSESNVDLAYLFDDPRENDSDVDTYNITAGLQGSIPDTDWTWEVFANFGESSTYAIQTGVKSLNRLRALITSPNWGQGFSAQSNDAGDGFGANFATCTSGYNFFADPSTISQDCREAIRADLKNRSKIQQNIWEANITGSLFDLPAGPLQAALGASYRETNYIYQNDTLTTQGVSFQDQALGIYPSGDTKGEINVKELYGELLVPVLRDSFIRSLDLELGGRISDYNTTGTSYTYKLLGDMAVTDWLRVRGGFNRAERAPNIAELFLSPQQTFAFNALGDICSKRSSYRISAGAGTPNEADITAVCAARMDATAGVGSGSAYYGQPVAQMPAPGGGFAFPTLVGNANLRPEVADTWTAGFVISSPFTSPALNRLRLSVDWFSIKIKDAIGFSPGAALQVCFDPFYNPLVTGAAGSSSQAAAAAAADVCNGVNYQASATPGGAPNLGNIIMTYNNSGAIDIEGIDAQLDWAVPVGPGTLNLNVVGSYFIHYNVAELASNPNTDYTGTFGTTAAGLSGAAFEWQTLTTLGYRVGGANLALQWQHRPSVEDSSEALFPTPTTGGPSYDMFNLSGSYALTENLTVRFGVDNLFNKRPPYTGIDTSANTALGQLPGGSFSSQYYNTLGRRYSLGANVKF
ncbi:TonB-dependent receptor domain-containing protein [Croceibacterium aestuarii]|uniref:TonB-dependent receptor domain-containing protein n=1 Tax=Croceibacterium aestuarii TaxID=3064139 RepID=UPI00272DE411|nr:TonB-dependent receptor [Croceibacterium sp. D39]